MPSCKRNPITRSMFTLCGKGLPNFVTSLFTAVPRDTGWHSLKERPVYTRYMLRTNQPVTSQQKPFEPQCISHSRATNTTCTLDMCNSTARGHSFKHLTLTDVAPTILAEGPNAATDSVSSDCPRHKQRRRFKLQAACSAWTSVCM